MQNNNKIYFDTDHEYYFLIPDDIELMPGDFEISTLLGHKKSVNPDALEPFVISREEAEDVLGQKMRTGIQQIAGAVTDFIKSLEDAGNPSKPGDSRPKITLPLLADLMDVPLDALRNNPEARKYGWKNLFDYITNVIVYSMSDNPEHNQQARDAMASTQALFDSYGIETNGFFSKTPDQIRELYLAAKQKSGQSDG